jgi:phosphate transport system protein
MAKCLQHALDTLERDLRALAGLVETATGQAARALRENDLEVARQVIAGESRIDREENHLDEECLKVLALYQPVATDLRRVTVALMLATDLERMGDLAEKIANHVLQLARSSPVPVPEKLQSMAELTADMVRQSLEAFFDLDVPKARLVWDLDDAVDHYNTEVIQELLEVMHRSPDHIDVGLSLFSATRHLERIADHATNIAEEVIYLAGGKIVRHCPAAVHVQA